MDSSQFNDPMIMRQIIVEHYQNPENKGIVEDSQDYININQKIINLYRQLNSWFKNYWTTNYRC